MTDFAVGGGRETVLGVDPPQHLTEGVRGCELVDGFEGRLLVLLLDGGPVLIVQRPDLSLRRRIAVGRAQSERRAFLFQFDIRR